VPSAQPVRATNLGFGVRGPRFCFQLSVRLTVRLASVNIVTRTRRAGGGGGHLRHIYIERSTALTAI
jgi:hypothetical protein